MVKPRGRYDAPVVIVGDAPTDKDIQEGQAFSGVAFDLMQDILAQSDIPLEDCVFVNAVTFQKYEKRGALTKDDIRPDADKYLLPFIAQHPRDMVIALGNNALCAVGIEKKPEKVNSHRSKRCESELFKQLGISAQPMASIHPWFVLKEPDLDREVLCDFRYMSRIRSGAWQEQVPMEIIDLDTPEKFDLLWEALKKNPEMYYDYESTDLDRDRAVPVSMSFCNGLKNQSGEYIVWFWAGYDRLRPRYDADTMEAFRLRIVEFLEAAGEKYDLGGWNCNYDDWLSESLAAKKFPMNSIAEWDAFGQQRKRLPGSQYDGMLMKWTVDNRRPHGLKEATAMYLGYPNYDKKVDEETKAIKERRGKILKHEDDFFVIEWYGLTPHKTKTGFQWPKKPGPDGKLIDALDKGIAMYAMMQLEDLRLYNCYDALYTFLNCKKLGEVIDREDLSYACDFRHRLARELFFCEQRGMLCDVELNRKFSKELKEIEERCTEKIKDELVKMGIDMPDFNPNSGDQLIEVLFGKPIMLPFIDRGPLYKRWGREVVNNRASLVEMKVYEDVDELPQIIAALQAGYEIDIDGLAQRLKLEYMAAFGDEIETYQEPYYINGMYRPMGWTKSGKPSTTGALLQSMYLADPQPFLALVLMVRRASKLRGTFVDGIFKKLDPWKVLRSRFNAIGTETGRISSSNPNGQNFQKNIRGQLIPRPGYKFLEWDLSQAEIRGIAAESGDPGLIAALDSSDIHTRIASMIFKIPESEVNKDTHRRYAKTIVFGLIYGMSAYRLSAAIGVSIDEAEHFMEEFFAAFPVMKQWLDRQIEKAHQYPYYVYTPWGTRRSTRNVLSVDRGVVSHTERVATNMPIQGGAGELCLWYICEIMDRIRDAGWDAWLVNTTHDSCTLEVREDLVWYEGDEIAGPVADIVRKVIAMPPPVHPLNTVSWKADLELNDWWSAEPNLQKALDPNLGKKESIFRWDLLRDDVLDPEEQAELDEVDAVMMAWYNNKP